MLAGRRQKTVSLALCAFALAASVSVAQASSGGVAPPSDGAGSEPSAASANSWTVYKKATWYGPGFWGNQTACGMKLTPTTIGTAHKKLPCGTLVTFTRKGRSITASPAGADSAVMVEAYDPTIFIFDAYPGGIGFAELLFARHQELLRAADDLIRTCPCEHGCPMCTGPMLEVGPAGKQATLAILALIRTG